VPFPRPVTALAGLLAGAALVFLSAAAGADALPRTASLGVAPVAVPADLAAKVGPGRGVLVRQVLPGLNADRLGLVAGDVILSLNGMPTDSPPALVAAIGTVRDGDRLALRLWRDGKEQELAGTARGRPLESHPDAEVRYGAVPFRGGLLRDILVLPKGRADAPVVYIIQGYTCASMESPDPDFLYRRLTGDLLALGIGTYRIEKPGMGDSRGTPACGDIDFTTEMAGFRAGYDALRDQRGVPADRVFLFGHSMGGLQAPLLAADGPAPRGVAVYGTVLRNWYDYIRDVIRTQTVQYGDGDPVDSAALAERARDTLRRFYLDGQTPAALVAADPRHGEILNGFHGWDGGDRLLGRHYSYWHQLPGQPLTAAWRDSLSPALVLHGAEDAAALNDEDHRLIADVVNHYRPGTACYVEFLDTDHGMVRVGPRRQPLAPAERAGNPRVAAVLADWIAATLARPPVVAAGTPAPADGCAGITLTADERV